jgi:Serine dehydrogenase proteinase
MYSAKIHRNKDTFYQHMTTKRTTKINRPPNLFAKTQVSMKRLEKALGAPLITYWNGPNGSVCQNDVVGFYELLKRIGKQDKMYLFIKSDGGTASASLRIVHLLRAYTKELIVLVPLECMSAATMISLGADEIRMGPMAQLSAVDTSITHDLSPVDKDNRRVRVSQNELARILNGWRQEKGGDTTHPFAVLFQHVHPLVFGAVDRISSLSIRLCNEILSYHMKDKKKAQQISHLLNEDYPSHSYPITIKEAERIGLKVTELDVELNSELLVLNQLYAEMGQQALTDYDEFNYHDNETLNILECNGMQVFFQSDKDWHYRKEERRWVTMNDQSAWRRMEKIGSQTRESTFHIR